MKQTLQLKMGQQLTMTPQLQQAIRLLQLSSIELQLEIQEALDSNVMLEEGAEDESQSDRADSKEGVTEDSADTTTSTELELGESSNIPDDLPIDTAWEDIYDNQTFQAPTPSSASDEQDFTNFKSEITTLNNHLLWQLNISTFSETDNIIAMAIIDSIGPDGYCHADMPTILTSLQLEDVELDEVEAVLHRIQNFDPPGVGARNLQECLLIQLKQLPHETPYYTTAEKILTQYLQVLASRDLASLKRKLKQNESVITGAILLIQSLYPRPGNSIESSHAAYVTPDVYVVKRKHSWRVELNTESAPKLRINATYANLIKRADNSADNTCLKNHMQEARWFIKSLQSRNETLLKVATSIVEFQKAFFEYGEEAMKPLVLREIAEVVELHESTVSRVTSQKYMHTPRGIFEFKYFFGSHVNTHAGGECSSTAIRAVIKKLITQEPQRKPLSDNKLSQLLAEQGINVARRTIAKYREAMSIPPSNERKRLF